MVTIIPRVVIKKLSLQLRATYEYDISNKSWKKRTFNDADLTDLPKLSSHGLSLSFAVGYCF